MRSGRLRMSWTGHVAVRSDMFELQSKVVVSAHLCNGLSLQRTMVRTAMLRW